MAVYVLIEFLIKACLSCFWWDDCVERCMHVHPVLSAPGMSGWEVCCGWSMWGCGGWRIKLCNRFWLRHWSANDTNWIIMISMKIPPPNLATVSVRHWSSNDNYWITMISMKIPPPNLATVSVRHWSSNDNYWITMISMKIPPPKTCNCIC